MYCNVLYCTVFTVIYCIFPDVVNLVDKHSVEESQEKVNVALMDYSSKFYSSIQVCNRGWCIPLVPHVYHMYTTCT